MKAKILVYTKFERFWHWTQALLVILLALTGFEIHGIFSLFGYERAVTWHNTLAYSFLALIAFAIFWHFITGEWRQYIPTKEKLGAMIAFYSYGIFKGRPHPVEKTRLSKLNPLQRLAYLSLKILLIPVLGTSGILYMQMPHYEILRENYASIAVVHTFSAFLLIAFTIVHVYLTTTGHSIFSNLKAMITGYEEESTDTTPARTGTTPTPRNTSDAKAPESS